MILEFVLKRSLILASKPIPIMVLGVLIGRKTYTFRKVIFVLAIVAGVMLFIFKDKYDEKDGEDPLLGNTLIGISLLMDGLCGASEDRMRSESRPTPLNFMHFMNMWSTLILIIGVIVFGEAPKFVDFVTRHPEILKFLGLAVLVGACGQIFISSMVANFGPLPLSIVTTTRKFFSVFLSVVLFGNSLGNRQWLAASIIFGALFLDAIINKKAVIKPEVEQQIVEDTKQIDSENVHCKHVDIAVIDLPVKSDK